MRTDGQGASEGGSVRGLVAAAAGVAGALLVVVPRWVLPACEPHPGFPAMHCVHTARGEMALGALLVLVAIGAAMARPRRATMAFAVAALGISAAALALPERVGYCHSPGMPCTSGMVPAVRLVAGASALVLTLALVAAARRARRETRRVAGGRRAA